jgi:hypothetical protein
VPSFSKETAASLAQFIDYAYAFSAGSVPGTYPPSFPSGLPSGYTIVALAQAVDDFWGHSTAEYYGIVATSSNQIVIAIRGTGDISEWLIDFEFPLTPFRQISHAGSVEFGFDSVFSSMFFVDLKGNPFDLGAYLTQAITENPATEIVIEGHSLGGALVSMLALMLSYGNTVVKGNTTVYTFASPAAGNGSFAAFYDSNAPLTYRIWNPWDLVHTTPPASFGYAQVAGAGLKLEPSLSQLEQYDFLSVDCNHSLRTYQWLLDSQYTLLPTCQWHDTLVQALEQRATKLGAALSRMRYRKVMSPRPTTGSTA